MDKPLIISDFQKGIGDSYNANFANFQNCDIYSVPGSVKISNKTANTYARSSSVYTDTLEFDYLTLTTAPGWTTGTPIVFTTNTCPSPLSINTVYYAIMLTPTHLQVASSYANALAGTYITLTSFGSFGLSVYSYYQMGLVKQFVQGSVLYALDENNVVWYYDTTYSNWFVLGGKGNGSGAGYGMALWKDYLFVFRATTIDVWGPISGTPAWTTSWQTITTASFHPSLVGQDDILYIGCGRYVASVMENTGQTFAPGTGATFTWSAQALDLPSEYSITTMVELGTNLLLGTEHSYLYKARIYPWDRISSSFGLPVDIQENGVKQMININNLVYVMAGKKGHFYVTDGTSAKEYRDIPPSLIGSDVSTEANLITYPYAILNIKGHLHTGFGVIGNTLTNMGVYAFGEKATLSLANTISTGYTGGTTNDIHIGALSNKANNAYWVSWQDGTTYGIDAVSETLRYTTYTAFFETGFYQIGTKRQPKTLQFFEILLARELSTGQGVRLSYRVNKTDAYTVIGTFDYATHGALHSYVIDNSTVLADQIQFKVELTSTNATSPELRSLIIS